MHRSLSIAVTGYESGALNTRRAIVNFIRCFMTRGEMERNFIEQLWPIQEAYEGNVQYYLVKITHV